MKAPRIYVVVGWNHREGELFAWYFDEQDAREHAKRIQSQQGDEYAVIVKECEAGEPMPERRW